MPGKLYKDLSDCPIAATGTTTVIHSGPFGNQMEEALKSAYEKRETGHAKDQRKSKQIGLQENSNEEDSGAGAKNV